MFERNMISVQGGLFAGKGKAKPTADYIPQLSTESPASIEETPETEPPALEEKDAEAVPGSDGLGTLIRRRVPIGQETEDFLESEAPHDHDVRDDYAQADREVAQRVERESAELSAKASEQTDRGMLYETLRLGLPTPPPEEAEAKPSRPVPAEDTAPRETAQSDTHVSPPPPEATETQPPATTAPMIAAAPKKPKRRKMTVRLQREEWQRLKSHADETDRTYQDILSTATTSYLDEILDDDSAPPAPPADLAKPESQAAKSPYDWFRTNRAG